MILTICVDFSDSQDPRLARVKFGIPQFFNEMGGPFLEENLYLRKSALRLSEKSIKTLSEHVKEFTVWRLDIDVVLPDISDMYFEYYIDALCSYVRKTGVGLSWNTINSRVSGAHRFLVWCKLNKICTDIQLEQYQNSPLSGSVEYRVKGHPGRKLEKPTKFLILEKAIELIKCIATVSGKSESARVRNCLIAKLMLQCGLRLSEAVNFPISDLPEIINRGHSTPARVIGKGSKRRVILIPNRLLADLWNYIDVERTGVLEKLKNNNVSVAGNDFMFLSNHGAVISGNWLEKIFARASSRIGMQAVPHSLRHTYGTYHYLKNKDLVSLSRLMGHESISTTEKLYVHTAVLVTFSEDYESLQSKVDLMCADIL